MIHLALYVMLHMNYVVVECRHTIDGYCMGNKEFYFSKGQPYLICDVEKRKTVCVWHNLRPR